MTADERPPRERIAALEARLSERHPDDDVACVTRDALALCHSLTSALTAAERERDRYAAALREIAETNASRGFLRWTARRALDGDS